MNTKIEEISCKEKKWDQNEEIQEAIAMKRKEADEILKVVDESERNY